MSLKKKQFNQNHKIPQERLLKVIINQERLIKQHPINDKIMKIGDVIRVISENNYFLIIRILRHESLTKLDMISFNTINFSDIDIQYLVGIRAVTRIFHKNAQFNWLQMNWVIISVKGKEINY